MINYNFTEDDIKFVEKAIEVKNKGWYMDGAQLTQVYNRVLNKRANPTSCGSCIRQRICELETALNSFKQKMANEAIKSEISYPVEASDSVSSDEPTVVKVEEENKPVVKKAGRPKKK